MNYGEVLSRAWQIIWKHKALWIFGILAACGSTSGGGGQGNINYTLSGEELPPAMENFFRQFEQMSQGQLALIIGAGILIMIVLIILAIFLSTVGRIGIYRGTQLADSSEVRLPFGEVFRGALPYFWRVFLLNLLVGLVIFVIVLLLIGVGVLSTVITFGVALLCFLPLICLLIPIGWLVGIWVEQANLAVVVENLRIIEALRRGWQVFRDNPGTMIVMGLILVLGFGLIGGLIISAPLFFIAIPAIVGSSISSGAPQNIGLAIYLLCMVAYLPVLLVLSGILKAYIESAWTLTNLRITQKPVTIEPVTEVTS